MEWKHFVVEEPKENHSIVVKILTRKHGMVIVSARYEDGVFYERYTGVEITHPVHYWDYIC
jgi:hypothetical protein